MRTPQRWAKEAQRLAEQHASFITHLTGYADKLEADGDMDLAKNIRRITEHLEKLTKQFRKDRKKGEL